jgi:hypothetical protein
VTVITAADPGEKRRVATESLLEAGTGMAGHEGSSSIVMKGIRREKSGIS